MGKPRPGFTVWNERRIPPAEKEARDLDLLRALGKCKTWEYAEHMGVKEATAKNRLRRLYEAGLADRHRERGQIGWTYTAKETAE
jgi:predicted transcriptional regulator